MDHSLLVVIRPYVQVSTLMLATFLVCQACGIDIDKKVSKFVNQFRMVRTLREKSVID